MSGTAAAVVMMNIGGSLDVGAIDAAAALAIGRPSGPIRIAEGISGPKGYGLLHVESNERRMKQIGGLSFGSASDFMVHIAANWSEIREGSQGRLILVCLHQGYGLRGIVEWVTHNGTGCWCMVTAIPGRTGGNEAVLYAK